MTIRHLFIAYVALISATAFGLNDASAAVIYEVSPATTEHTPGAGSGGMFANRTAFDSFILDDAATITSIRWLGSGSISPHTFEVGLYENTTENSAFARPLTTPIVETVSPASRTLSTQHPDGFRCWCVPRSGYDLLARDTKRHAGYLHLELVWRFRR